MEPRTFTGFLVAIAAVIVIAVLSYDSSRQTAQSAQSLAGAVEVLSQIQGVMSTLKDAETGQRGYLLTGRESYLEPFIAAKQSLPERFAGAAAAIGDHAPQRQRLERLRELAAEKMQEVDETVDLRRKGDAAGALAIVLTDRGKNIMDQIRLLSDEMQNTERQLIAERSASWRRAASFSFAVISGGSLLLLVLIAVAAAMASREFRGRQRESWLREGQLGLSALMQGDLPLERLADNVVQFLAHYLEAQVGALFVTEGSVFRRAGGYAIPAEARVDSVRGGDGLTGQAAKDRRPLHVREVPEGYLPIGSTIGRGAPAELLIAPAVIEARTYAVIELGFFGAADPAKAELLERVSEPVAAAIRASRDRTRLEELLQETQQQAEELQTREEELRVNNEELEEQSRALRESRTQLESQQAELEQINAQLEEQAQALEHQKEALSRSHVVLTERSAELQRANEYKSEFLANMSHELRTPLNSTLILAKLLADNEEGNLNETQVRFAQTISSAGKDLLTLINDVLDLSRIEAGKIEVAPEQVNLAAMVDSMSRLFQPQAIEKQLAFRAELEPELPAQIETDPQRLGQILRNLLSNALKFTHRGEIGLRVYRTGADRIAFAVRYSGVGIEPHQHEVIFEAFRQADGSIHRKYGGTGLGLSISRDLAQLLGGSIAVQSTPGAGSTFTLTLPLKYSPAAPPQPESARLPEVLDVPVAPAPAAARRSSPSARCRTTATGSSPPRGSF